MELETKTTMDTSGAYVLGGGYSTGFCDLEKSIGDAKSILLMRAGDSEARLSALVASGEGKVITEVNDAESTLLDKMGDIAYDNAKNHSDIASRQASALTSMERDLQNRIHENRSYILKEIGDKSSRTEDIINNNALRVADQSSAQFGDLKNQLRYFEVSTTEKFGRLETEGLKNTSRILETIAANKYDALKDEVDAIRSDRYADKYGYNFALQNQELNYLKNMIGSVEQNQRFGSKTVQFGTGNTAGTAQTANQG